VTYSGKNGVFITFKREFEFEKDIKIDFVIDKGSGELVPANPGSFLGEIDEFNLSGTEDIESAYDKISEYKQLVKNQIGVRVFRDGFGVKPYGMEDNDWLRLSRGQTSGGSFYLLRPENVIGFVSITAKENGFLAEKTDREGFIDTPYSKTFFTIINLIIQNINDVLDKTRRSYDEFKRKDAEAKGNIRSFIDTRDRLIATSRQSSAIEAETQKVHRELKATAKKVTEAVSKIKNEPLFSSAEENKALQILEEVDRILSTSNRLLENVNSLLQNAKKLEDDANYLEPKLDELERQIVQFSELAGLGMTAEAFTHEMYNLIDRLASQNDQTFRQLRKEGLINANLNIYFEHVKGFIQSTRIQLNHLAPSFKFNRETKQVIQMSEFVEELKRFYSTRFADIIDIHTAIKLDFSIKMNRGKLTQVLDNLILNSEYWLKQVIKTDNHFKAVINIEVDSSHLLVSDNGYGVLPAFESTLFQPFVTAKPSGEGRGLGLFIVQQLLDSVDTTIQLLQKRNEHNRRYLFQINFQNILVS